MNDEQLLRYNRQIMLPQIGYEGQQRLAGARVLLIGLGGLGSPAAMYLAAAGTGHLVLVDFDTVELTNLQRQIVHRTADIGEHKAVSAKNNLLAINPEIRIDALTHALDADELEAQVRQADVVIDACDNYATRFEINAACVRQRTPLVSGAAIRLEGQLSVFDKRDSDSPCYNCLYPQAGEDEETCSNSGVLAPVVGIIGSIQALEAIKLICDIGKTLHGRVLILDALTLQWRTMKLRRDPACPVCGG
jgi:adenylyltransferase/sulfurtransferase